MCSTCGKKAATLPGAKPSNPIVFGEANDATPQPATFLQNYGRARAGHSRFVTGADVERAIEDGIIQIGYRPPTAVRPVRPVRALASNPDWYVKTGNNKWVGFKAKPAADRYAKTTGGTVQTREEVLKLQKDGAS